jgi:Tfp pilus assembly protein FimT
MPSVITPEKLAARVAHVLGVVPRNDVESLTEMLRTALDEARSAAIAAAKAVCLEIAEDEAEHCRSVGATAAQQTAFTIAARIRKRHVEVR